MKFTLTLSVAAAAVSVPENSVRSGRAELTATEAHDGVVADCTEYMCCQEKTDKVNQWACYGRWEAGETKTPGWFSSTSSFHRDLVWPVNEDKDNGCGGHWKVCVARHQECSNKSHCPGEAKCRMVERDHLTADGHKFQGTCTSPHDYRCFAESRAKIGSVRMTGKGSAWDQCSDGLECKRIDGGYSGICCPKDGNGWYLEKTVVQNEKGEDIEQFRCKEHEKGRGQRFMDGVKNAAGKTADAASSAASAVAAGGRKIHKHLFNNDETTGAPTTFAATTDSTWTSGPGTDAATDDGTNAVTDFPGTDPVTDSTWTNPATDAA